MFPKHWKETHNGVSRSLKNSTKQLNLQRKELLRLLLLFVWFLLLLKAMFSNLCQCVRVLIVLNFMACIICLEIQSRIRNSKFYMFNWFIPTRLKLTEIKQTTIEEFKARFYQLGIG